MSKKEPHIIYERGIVFELGKLKGTQILYEFDKILEYLNNKGKHLFGKNFKIYDEDLDIIYKLCLYFLFKTKKTAKNSISISTKEFF